MSEYGVAKTSIPGNLRVQCSWARAPGFTADTCMSTVVDATGRIAVFNFVGGEDSVFAKTAPVSTSTPQWTIEERKEVESEHAAHLARFIVGVSHV